MQPNQGGGQGQGQPPIDTRAIWREAGMAALVLLRALGGMASRYLDQPAQQQPGQQQGQGQQPGQVQPGQAQQPQPPAPPAPPPPNDRELSRRGLQPAPYPTEPAGTHPS